MIARFLGGPFDGAQKGVIVLGDEKPMALWLWEGDCGEAACEEGLHVSCEPADGWERYGLVDEHQAEDGTECAAYQHDCIAQLLDAAGAQASADVARLQEAGAL